MNRLIKKANAGAIKEFIEKFYHNSGQMSPLDFRKAFFKEYQEEIKKYPQLHVELEDEGYEGGYGIGLLYEIVNNLVYELQGSDSINEIEENLKGNEINDFWLEIPNHYKAKGRGLIPLPLN